MKRKGTKELFCAAGKFASKWKRAAGIVGGVGILAVSFLMVKKLRERRREKEQSELIPLNEDFADEEQTVEEE